MERVRVFARRLAERHVTRRRALVALLVVALLLAYGPPLLRGLRSAPPRKHTCDSLRDHLRRHDKAVASMDARLHAPELQDAYAPYVGNGYFGLEVQPSGNVNIKSGRTLALPVPFHPLVTPVVLDMETARVTDYVDGVVHQYYCSSRGYDVEHACFAHRSLPHLLFQRLRVSNPTSEIVQVPLRLAGASDWFTAVRRDVRLDNGVHEREYDVYTGTVDSPELPGEGESAYVVSIVVSKLLPTISLLPGEIVELDSFTVIQYSGPVPKASFAREKSAVEQLAIQNMEKAIQIHANRDTELRTQHSEVWRQLWFTGFSISESLAVDALNGDKINATMYNVLSQVRTFEYEESMSALRKAEILRSLAYAEGCYEGHHTLQAENLWKPMKELPQINSVVGAWMLTLEKQGCHNLLKAGASGVIQAMVLSFGGLRFSNQHLEFNIHPSDLHRDFHFRRVNYGNMTHVNISVVVQDDNKAALYVVLDRSDKSYYACDAGCLDSPILLGPSRKFFPVKLTDPITSVLYITSDKQHMEDLRHAIHVKEVVLAPAHEHHVIALHKHGHSLGGLPTLFWVTICFIIVVFHLFLCRIIMTEYCDSPDKYRRLYSKP